MTPATAYAARPEAEMRAAYQAMVAPLLAAYEQARRQGDERAMDRLADEIGTARAEWEGEADQ